MSDQPIIVMVGTRPEGIKMVPVYLALRQAGHSVLLCATMQHLHLLQEVFNVFGVQPDINFDIMRTDQDLFYLTQSILIKTKSFFLSTQPKLVLVQGDTTTAFVSALSAFYLKVPVGHIEAGLRTGDKYAPFPEEMNRTLISSIAQLHFAPTKESVNNLQAQAIKSDAIFLTGNTVVDALYMLLKRIDNQTIKINVELVKRISEALDKGMIFMLLTMHRRESFDGGIEEVLSTIKNYLSTNKNIFCIYPYHPNPNVMRVIKSTGIGELDSVYLCGPLPYQDFIYVLRMCQIIVTDSGGIQEEAVSLGKQVIIVRNSTERMEGILAGMAHLVGTDSKKIIEQIEHVLTIKSLSLPIQLYGDGNAAQKIVDIIEHWLGQNYQCVSKKFFLQSIQNNIAKF
jgi:UDP-N-acetylglucosamine 2-epimerase (non-hydrolysing)